MAKKEMFPKLIYVTREHPASDESYLAVQGNVLNEVEDGAKVAVYKLVEVRTAKVTRELE
jgi:hypothetical protein